ncbi:ribosomal protein L32 [Roseateles asaccharophilus]
MRRGFGLSLTNYRDVSTSMSDVSAGFQFEFYCEKCGETSRSAFRPYRKGQITGWLSRFAFMFHDLSKASRATGAFAEAGGSGAKAEALEEARALAAALYERCTGCRKWVGRECWDGNAGSCRDCATKAAANSGGGYGSQGGYGAASGGAACPNCQTASQGGRFCHECGFDMASTHKSCPACGITLPRSARFCTDCGHGF